MWEAIDILVELIGERAYDFAIAPQDFTSCLRSIPPPTELDGEFGPTNLGPGTTNAMVESATKGAALQSSAAPITQDDIEDDQLIEFDRKRQNYINFWLTYLPRERSHPPTNDQMKIIDAKRKAVIDAKRKAVPMDESLSTLSRLHKVLKRSEANSR